MLSSYFVSQIFKTFLLGQQFLTITPTLWKAVFPMMFWYVLILTILSIIRHRKLIYREIDNNKWYWLACWISFIAMLIVILMNPPFMTIDWRYWPW